MKITPWIAAIALTVGLAPAVRAQYGQYDQHDQQGHDQQGRDHRDHDQQDQRGEGNWRYGTPSQEWHADRVSALAHEIDETATNIRVQAERNNRRPDHAEARALGELNQLNQAASRFHEQVEHNSASYSRTRNDFAELISAYGQAVEALRSIRPRPYVDRGMNRIAADMNTISRFYGRGYGRLFITGSWSNRSSRYDHGTDSRNNGPGRNN
jgi:hypothetical protein